MPTFNKKIELFFKGYSTNGYIFYFLQYIVIGVASLWIYKYKFPSNNNWVEIPPIFARISPDLYPRDYYIQANLQFTPRFYYHKLFEVLSQTNLTIENIYFLLYVLAFTSILTALYSIGQHLFKSKFSQCLLPFLNLTVPSGTIGVVQLIPHDPIPALYAMGLSIWGVRFSFKHQWFRAYLFFGIATLLQFLVGFLPACLFAISLIFDSLSKSKIKILICPVSILAIFLGLVYVPMRLDPAYSNFQITNPEFVYIYGYLRHPHHIVPSLWSASSWIDFLLFYTGGFFLIAKNRSLSTVTKRDLFFVVITMFVALVANYIFVEVFPIAIFAKLQFARMTPFARLAILVGICSIFDNFTERKIWVVIPVLLVSLILENIMFFTGISALIFLYFEDLNICILKSKLLFGVCILTLFLLIQSKIFLNLGTSVSSSFTILLLFVLMIPFWCELLPLNKSTYTAIFCTLAILEITLIGLGLNQDLGSYGNWRINSRIQINYGSPPALQTLATQFRDISSQDALVLTSPDAAAFRYYSRRSTVWDVKSFPYTDRDILTWKERAVTILGTQDLQPGLLNATELYQQRSSDELVEIARQYGATHLLTQQNWHSDIPHSSVLKEGDWVLYELPNSPSPESDER